MKEIKIGQIVYLNGEKFGEIVDSPTKGRFMVKPYNSEWSIDLGLFVWQHEDEMEIREND